MDGEAGGEEEGRARQSLREQEMLAVQVLQRPWRRRPGQGSVGGLAALPRRLLWCGQGRARRSSDLRRGREEGVAGLAAV